MGTTKPSGAKLFAMIVVGTIIGGLIAKLGGSQFREYVRMSQQNSPLHQTVADVANAIRPIAWFFPLIFGIYQCIRSRAAFEYVLLFGLIGGGFGWITSLGVPFNFYNVPIGCFVGTCIGADIQVIRWP